MFKSMDNIILIFFRYFWFIFYIIVSRWLLFQVLGHPHQSNQNFFNWMFWNFGLMRNLKCNNTTVNTKEKILSNSYTVSNCRQYFGSKQLYVYTLYEGVYLELWGTIPSLVKCSNVQMIVSLAQWLPFPFYAGENFHSSYKVQYIIVIHR